MSTVPLWNLLWVYGLFTLHLAVPGPSMLYIGACASRGQRGQALAFVAGTSIGTAFWAGIAVFGASRLVADAPLLIGAFRLFIGAALVGLGLLALVAAFERRGRAASGDRVTPRHACTHGILLTMASGNEIVFWTAIMALGTGTLAAAGSAPDLGFAMALVLGCVIIAFVVESLRALIATTQGVACWISRLRRPFEAALGAAFCATGLALLPLY